MSAKTIQYLLASVFLVLGGWCVVHPSSVMELAFTPQYQSDHPVVPILIGAFGAQALIAGAFAAFSTFTRATFAAYAVILLPFFVFDYWFYFVDPMLTEVGLLDAVGNVAMLVLCWLGWRATGTQANAEPKRGIGLTVHAKRLWVAAIMLAVVAADLTGMVPITGTTGQAHAVAGRPWTPLSAAGVARRTTRRVVRRSTLYVAALPPACVRTRIEGVTVWRCGATYYQPYRGRYVVVYID